MKKFFSMLVMVLLMISLAGCSKSMMNITVRQSRQSGVARATCPD